MDPLHLGESLRAVQTLGSADFHPHVEGISEASLHLLVEAVESDQMTVFRLKSRHIDLVAGNRRE